MRLDLVGNESKICKYSAENSQLQHAGECEWLACPLVYGELLMSYEEFEILISLDLVSPFRTSLQPLHFWMTASGIPASKSAVVPVTWSL